MGDNSQLGLFRRSSAVEDVLNALAPDLGGKNAFQKLCDFAFVIPAEKKAGQGLGTEGAQPCLYYQGLIEVLRNFPVFADIKKSGDDVQHIPPIFPLAEMLQELGDCGGCFEIVIGNQGRLGCRTSLGGSKDPAAKGSGSVNQACVCQKKWAWGGVAVVAGIDIATLQTSCGEIVGGHYRRLMDVWFRELFSKLKRQLFRDDKTEDLFTFKGGDGDIPGAAGAAPKVTGSG